MSGKKWSEERRKQFSDRLKTQHHRANLWSLRSPKGEIFKTKNLAAFCEEHDLSKGAFLGKHSRNEKTAILRGKNRGWVVLWSYPVPHKMDEIIID